MRRFPLLAKCNQIKLTNILFINEDFALLEFVNLVINDQWTSCQRRCDQQKPVFHLVECSVKFCKTGSSGVYSKQTLNRSILPDSSGKTIDPVCITECSASINAKSVLLLKAGLHIRPERRNIHHRE